MQGCWTCHKAHHWAIMHVCLVCPETFRRFGELKKHLRARHSLELENQQPRLARRPFRPILPRPEHLAGAEGPHGLHPDRVPRQWPEPERPGPIRAPAQAHFHARVQAALEAAFQTPVTPVQGALHAPLQAPIQAQAVGCRQDHQDGAGAEGPPRPQRRHLLAHSGENSLVFHQCEKCPQKFSRFESLVTHSLIHVTGGPRHHECTECPCKFASLKELKEHLRIHFIEKPHQCPECPRSFLYHSELKKHFRSHTGERPYQCSVCFRSYTALSGLRAHYISSNSKKCQEKINSSARQDHSGDRDEVLRNDAAALDLRISDKTT